MPVNAFCRTSMTFGLLACVVLFSLLPGAHAVFLLGTRSSECIQPSVAVQSTPLSTIPPACTAAADGSKVSGTVSCATNTAKLFSNSSTCEAGTPSTTVQLSDCFLFGNVNSSFVCEDVQDAEVLRVRTFTSQTCAQRATGDVDSFMRLNVCIPQGTRAIMAEKTGSGELKLVVFDNSVCNLNGILNVNLAPLSGACGVVEQSRKWELVPLSAVTPPPTGSSGSVATVGNLLVLAVTIGLGLIM